MSLLFAPVVACMLAQGEPPPARAREVLTLEVQGSKEAQAHLERSLTELLARLGVTVTPPAPGPPPFLRATVEVEPTAALVSLRDRQGQLVLFRRVPQQGSPEIVWEATAHVIHASVEELLLADRTPRAPLVSTGRPVQLEGPGAMLPVAKRGIQEGPGLSVSGFAGGRLFGGGSSESPVVAAGLGAELCLSLVSRWQPALRLEVSYGSPFEVVAPLVTMHSQTISLRLLPTARLWGNERWGLHASLGGGANLFATSLGSVDVPQQFLGRPRLDAAPVLTAAFSARLSVGRASAVYAALSADVDLAPRRFVADVAGARTTLYEPWRVRPALVLGFSWSALGPAPWPDAEGTP